MKNLIHLGATLSVAVLFAGCTGVAAGPSTAEPSGNNRPASSAPAATDAATTDPAPATTEAESSPTPTDDPVKAFGASYTWEDGLAVTVSKPADFKPGEWSQEEGYDKYVVFEITLVNNSGTPWDPGMFYATLQSANEEAPTIYDSEQLGERPSTKLLNGREAKFKMAFAVKDPSDLVMELRPDFDHESVLYQLG
ncbi:hypothetical protein ACPCG0_12640 [Propionibacteriaceae bacterium Y1923]|uniref:hypothetical protein n=1 Tax=Aestuariimicrobium sp. Y1814 TaxID=3418742 RepID=UPI003C25C24B